MYAFLFRISEERFNRGIVSKYTSTPHRLCYLMLLAVFHKNK